ncbi:molybdopterin-dependent oxidoreductase [Martelella mangrovi]|uniref:Biotin/methionine sulfoxide reductase n=1 Tax=Martelella mangrovi TaxID=1397477 RepID=A0ABV2ICN5_9HYPH
MSLMRATSLCHWGAFEATVEDGRLTQTRPLRDSGADPDMIGAWSDLVYSESRIDRPYVRAGFLRKNGRKGQRGRDEMIPVSWEQALDLVAGELHRVYRDHGPASVFGGSYGWSSAGRLHHARTQIRRFLAAAGGFTDQTGNYSWGAANIILPHVVGDASAVSHAATSWETIATDGDCVVAFGGLNPKNWRVTSGGAGEHHIPDHIVRAGKRGVRFIVISPFRGDIPEGLDAEWIAPRPNTDTAIMLGLAHQALVTGRADRSFLDRYTAGQDQFFAYLRGEQDGIEKTLDWAADISGLQPETLQALWEKISTGRIMLTASWSLQRADHGEQPYWALIALAAMLGQIGLPGGGFCFGYGSMNGVGAMARRGYVPVMPGLPNPAASAIPAACVTDCFANPGKEIAFNGRTLRYPDTRLVYWAGGNPFHHAQDLNLLEKAWQRPETVIVHEPWWTPTARRADIVLPATTSLERNDIGGSSRDPYVFFMPKLIDPVGEARDDFAIFGAIAERLGCKPAYDEGRSEEAWLRHLWSLTEAKAAREGIAAPDFETLRQNGYWHVPPPEAPEVMLAPFRADPAAHPLKTPSGRIELSSATIAAFDYDDCPSHPSWLEPVEWLGAAEGDELHLLTNQPEKQLHGQLYPVLGAGDCAPVTLHPDDAARRAIAQDSLVRVFNGRGACLARARLSNATRKGVALMPTGAWFEPDDDNHIEANGNPNALTADRQTSALSRGCAALSALVRIEPWQRSGIARK